VPFRRRQPPPPPPKTVLSPLRVAASKNGLRTSTRSALTASGQKIDRENADATRRVLQPWQSRSFAYYDAVPEIKYAAQFYSRALSVLRLFPATRDEGDDLIELEDPEDPAVEALGRIQDPGGGRSSLLANYGRLMFLIGEALLFVSRDEENRDVEQWEMLSPDELRLTSSGYQRFKAPSLQPDFYKPADPDDFVAVNDEEAVAYRLWRRHPRYSMLADSTMQAVLDVAEELVLLTQSVRARARSRLAGSGILLVNGKISPPPPDAEAADENPEEDPFIADLTEAMTTPISDEGAASAVVPLVVRTDIDDLDTAMRHVQIIDPTQFYPETGLRTEAIRRLAIGLDMPPEILLGLGEVNHWGAWGIDEHAWKAHLQPVAQQLVDDLTSAYFQPYLRDIGVENWQDYVVAYDATKVINRPDRSKDAKDLYDRRAIGKAALREANGFDDEDEPTQEEWNEEVGIAVRDASLAVYGIPTVRGTGGIEPAPGQIEKGEGGDTTVDKSVAPAEAPKGPPATGGNGAAPAEEQEASVVGSNAYALAPKVLGASQLALMRTRELAGSRLRNYAKRDVEATALIDGVRSRDVPHVLGRERARALGAPAERELVAGAEQVFAEAMRLWDVPEQTAARLSALMLDHAARYLYEEEPPPLPQTYQNYVSALGVA
jgi:hypothetical protein